MTPEEIANTTKAECLQHAYAAMARRASHLEATAWFLAAQHAPDAPAAKQDIAEPAWREALIDRDDDIWYASGVADDQWSLQNDDMVRSRQFIKECYGPVRHVRIIDLDD